ncbi:MAG: TonB family protein [Flavobacteriales bacterium]|nr:TonB family protein [Flavobacteriales bacterium]
MCPTPDTQKDRRKAIITTVTVHALMLVGIFLLGVKYLDPPPLSGVIVAFGVDEDAAADPAYNPEQEVQIQTSTPQTSQQVEVPEEMLVTQTEDSPLEVKKQEKPTEKPVKEKPKKAPEKPAEKVAEKEVKKAPEAPKPSSATATALANILSNGSDQSKGNGQGTGYKGSPDGSMSSSNYGVSGSGGDGNYRLAGRSAISKPKPEYSGKDQGTVKVKIQVDRQGNVISAKYTMQGTEVTDPVLLRNAENAAKATKWTANPSGEPVQEGYIIYNFKIGG